MWSPSGCHGATKTRACPFRAGEEEGDPEGGGSASQLTWRFLPTTIYKDEYATNLKGWPASKIACGKNIVSSIEHLRLCA